MSESVHGRDCMAARHEWRLGRVYVNNQINWGVDLGRLLSRNLFFAFQRRHCRNGNTDNGPLNQQPHKINFDAIKIDISF